MIDGILKKCDRKKLFVTIRPEILRKMIETGRDIYGTWKEFSKASKVSLSSLLRFNRSPKVAVSSNLLINLIDSTKTSIKEKDILTIQTNNVSYPLAANLIFIDNPFCILGEWGHYFLGALSSDGCIYKNRISFRINPLDVEFSALQTFTIAKLAEKVHEQEVHVTISVDRGKRFGKPSTVVYVSSSTFQIFLEKILKTDFGTNYSVPHWLFDESYNKFMYPWLAGLIDGDGYIWRNISGYREKWFLRIDNGSIKPLIELHKLLLKTCPFDSNPQKGGDHKFSFQITTLEFCQKMFPKILPFIVLARKREKIIQALDYLERKGFNTKISEEQRTTRNPIMDKVVEFLRERNLLTKLQNWKKLETYGKEI